MKRISKLLTAIVGLVLGGLMPRDAAALDLGEAVLFAEQFVVEKGELAGQKVWYVPPFADWSRYGILGTTSVVMTTPDGATIQKWDNTNDTFIVLASVSNHEDAAVSFPEGITLQPGDVVRVSFWDTSVAHVYRLLPEPEQSPYLNVPTTNDRLSNGTEFSGLASKVEGLWDWNLPPGGLSVLLQGESATISTSRYYNKPRIIILDIFNGPASRWDRLVTIDPSDYALTPSRLGTYATTWGAPLLRPGVFVRLRVLDRQDGLEIFNYTVRLE